MSTKEDEIFYQHLIQALRDARISESISQIELSKKIYRPQSYVSKYENGQRKIDPIQLIRICDALSIRASDLIRKIEKAVTENEI